MPLAAIRDASIAERLEDGSFLVVECTIPQHMTIAEWRRRRPSARSRRRRVIAVARRALQA